MASNRVISVKVPSRLYDAVDKYIKVDGHISKSDFVRDAIREKIKEDTSWIYDDMLRRPVEEKGLREMVKQKP